MMLEDANGAAGSNLPVMQDAKIRWNEEPVACIVAETQEQADHAAALVRVAYDVEPAKTSFASAKAKAKRPIISLASQRGSPGVTRKQLSPRRGFASMAGTRRHATTIAPSSCTRSRSPGRMAACWCTMPPRC
jgi:CO/xanthine dehydrogenase Mo-binding subunit